MATCDDKTPNGAAVEKPTMHRVIVRFRNSVQLPNAKIADNTVPEQVAQEWTLLRRDFPGVEWSSYFTSVGDEVLRQFDDAAKVSQLDVRLRVFFTITMPLAVDPKVVATRVRAWDSIEIAYVESNAANQSKVRISDEYRYSATQGYLNAAPEGIDARWAWLQTTGCGVGFVDIEQGWTFEHEDLKDAKIDCISGINKDYHGHGTAVLGIVMARRNRVGGVGIAYDATARAVSEWRTNTRFSTADAIVYAASKMRAGDVLLLESQFEFPSKPRIGYPVEIEEVRHGLGVVFAAIQSATNRGIVVIEPAGNGDATIQVDLDRYEDVPNNFPLNRNGTALVDSGAIMVGSAHANSRVRNLDCPTNFGSRIDCFAWGNNILTCGNGGQGISTTEYTTLFPFNSTSGASAIIAGAAVLVQAWRQKLGRPRYTPNQLRCVLSHPSFNTPSSDPRIDLVGVMPNLRKIMACQSTP